eukprot:6605605-Pyramimonas_sp.AAC.1
MGKHSTGTMLVTMFGYLGACFGYFYFSSKIRLRGETPELRLTSLGRIPSRKVGKPQATTRSGACSRKQKESFRSAPRQ